MNKGLSTLEEVKKRGHIKEISPSIIRKGVFIVTFYDGSQANINAETYNLLTE